MVLVFGELNEAQICKMPKEDSHHENEIVMSFNSLNLFEPIEHTKDYHIRNPIEKIFLFESEDEKIM